MCHNISMSAGANHWLAGNPFPKPTFVKLKGTRGYVPCDVVHHHPRSGQRVVQYRTPRGVRRVAAQGDSVRCKCRASRTCMKSDKHVGRCKHAPRVMLATVKALRALWASGQEGTRAALVLQQQLEERRAEVELPMLAPVDGSHDVLVLDTHPPLTTGALPLGTMVHVRVSYPGPVHLTVRGFASSDDGCTYHTIEAAPVEHVRAMIGMPVDLWRSAPTQPPPSLPYVEGWWFNFPLVGPDEWHITDAASGTQLAHLRREVLGAT